MSGERVIEIGGRKFVSVGESTVEHDHYFMRHVTRHALDRIVLQEGERPEDFADRLLRGVIASGKALPLLGCLIIPEGKTGRDWTPAMAEDTAAFLGSLTDPDEKKAVNGLVLDMLIDFFDNGISSLWRTAGTSAEADPKRAGQEKPSAESNTANGRLSS